MSEIQVSGGYFSSHVAPISVSDQQFIFGWCVPTNFDGLNSSVLTEFFGFSQNHNISELLLRALDCRTIIICIEWVGKEPNVSEIH